MAARKKSPATPASTLPRRLPKSTQLKPFSIDRSAAGTELASFQAWLAATPHFAETAGAVAEFAKRRHFAAAIGIAFGDSLFNPDRFDFELSLGSTYFPDIVIADAAQCSLLLVELEPAQKHSVFHVKKEGQQYPDFSSGFRQGFFQLLDWSHKLKDASEVQLRDWFTFVPRLVRTVLVIGRDEELGSSGSQSKRRLQSLADSFAPGGNRLYIVTYDELASQVAARLASPA